MISCWVYEWLIWKAFVSTSLRFLWQCADLCQFVKLWPTVRMFPRPTWPGLWPNFWMEAPRDHRMIIWAVWISYCAQKIVLLLVIFTIWENLWFWFIFASGLAFAFVCVCFRYQSQSSTSNTQSDKLTIAKTNQFPGSNPSHGPTSKMLGGCDQKSWSFSLFRTPARRLSEALGGCAGDVEAQFLRALRGSAGAALLGFEPAGDLHGLLVGGQQRGSQSGWGTAGLGGGHMTRGLGEDPFGRRQEKLIFWDGHFWWT